MDYITIIGLIAGVLTTGSFFPQIIKIYRNKKTRDLSLAMYIVLSSGIAVWIVYGFLSQSLPIIIANCVVLVLCVYIVIMKIRYR